MKQEKLKREYVRVWAQGQASFGASQSWLPGRHARACGCGLIACADTLLYLTDRRTLQRTEYLEYVAALRRYFSPIPHFGIDGLRLAWGINRCLARSDLPLRARWCASGTRFWQRVEEMLSRDCPAVIAIGQNFPRFWQKKELTLYRLTPRGEYVADCRVQGHYVTVTALDERYAEVSTWGRRLYVDRREFEEYVKRHSSWLFCNVLYLQEKNP